MLFHETLRDAYNAFHSGNVVKAKEILKQHQETELREANYIKSSLYAINIYLQNYINHVAESVAEMEKKEMTPEDKTFIEMNIKKAQENIKAFEDGIRELLQREEKLLE